jgi:hypothetical protein
MAGAARRPAGDSTAIEPKPTARRQVARSTNWIRLRQPRKGPWDCAGLAARSSPARGSTGNGIEGHIRMSAQQRHRRVNASIASSFDWHGGLVEARARPVHGIRASVCTLVFVKWSTCIPARCATALPDAWVQQLCALLPLFLSGQFNVISLLRVPCLQD